MVESSFLQLPLDGSITDRKCDCFCKLPCRFSQILLHFCLELELLVTGELLWVSTLLLLHFLLFYDPVDGGEVEVELLHKIANRCAISVELTDLSTS